VCFPPFSNPFPRFKDRELVGAVFYRNAFAGEKAVFFGSPTGGYKEK